MSGLMRYWCGILRYCSFSRPRGFSFFTTLVNFDVLYVLFDLFSVRFGVFRAPPPLTAHYIMADSGAFINVLNQEDYETREHCIENSNLLIEEPTERSQKFKRNIGVRHQEDKHQALSRQCVVWLPVELEHF